MTYERDGKRYTAELTPLYDEELGRYRYGFVGGEVEKGNVFKNLLYSGYEVKILDRYDVWKLKNACHRRCYLK